MKTTKAEKLIYFALIMYYAGSFVANTIPRGQFIPVLAIGLMLLAHLARTQGRIRTRNVRFIFYLVVFLLFCLSSMLWAQRPSLAVSKVNGIAFITVAMFVIGICHCERFELQEFLKAIMYGGYIVVIYTFFRYGIGGILRLAADDTRITNDLFNANTLGMCAAYSIVLNIYFMLNERIKFRDVLIIPAVVLEAVTQSRKAIIIVALGVVGLVVLKNLKKKDFGKSLLRVFAGLVAIALLFVVISRFRFMQSAIKRMTEIFDMLAGRGARTNNSAWLRFAYTKLGIQLFREHPILGIGIGNANIYTQLYYGHNHYLHNNYAELLACGGLLGFIVYYSMHIFLLRGYIRNWKYRNNDYDICLLLMLLIIIVDYGMVSYYSRTNYFYLFMIWRYAREMRQGVGQQVEESGLRSGYPAKENLNVKRYS